MNPWYSSLGAAALILVALVAWVRAYLPKLLERAVDHGFNRNLELYKSQLTLPSEVRRQVAAKKVEHLLDVYAQCMCLLRTAREEAGITDKWRKAVDDFSTVLDYAEVFFAPPDAERLRKYGVVASMAASDFEKKTMAMPPESGLLGDPFANIEESFRQVLALIRRELHLDESGHRPRPGYQPVGQPWQQKPGSP